MKLYFEDEDGSRHEVQRAAGLQQGDVILFVNAIYRSEMIEEWEEYLSKKLDRKVIILDGRFRDIAVVPPVLDAVNKSFQTDGPD